MEESVTSMLLSMTDLISLLDPTAALLKVTSHKPADVAPVEFVAHEAMTMRKVSFIGGSVYARCSELYPSTAGWALIERVEFIEMRLCLPACRSRENQYWTQDLNTKISEAAHRVQERWK